LAAARGRPKRRGFADVNEPRAQYAALPYRRSGDGIEILLVTSLETKRWILPKGWPVAGQTAHDSAASEAFEEGGIEGHVASDPIGSFDYGKRRKGGVVPCRVEVFPLEVTTEREDWPEQGRRERRWFTPEEAAVTVSDAGASVIITEFVRRFGRADPA
jgi:8-oxo-dGTP pyrophosphatase MutT (NUDIX family)